MSPGQLRKPRPPTINNFEQGPDMVFVEKAAIDVSLSITTQTVNESKSVRGMGGIGRFGGPICDWGGCRTRQGLLSYQPMKFLSTIPTMASHWGSTA